MKKNILILVLGFAAGVAISILPANIIAKNKYNYGKYHGELLTKLSIIDRIPAALGDDYTLADGYNTLFEVKDTAVVFVERNGVKTLRVFHARGISDNSHAIATNVPLNGVPIRTNQTSPTSGFHR